MITTEQLFKKLMRANKERWARSKKTEAYRLNYKKTHKVEILARQKMVKAIRSGRLKRGKCEICGKDKTHGHHEDYSKPLTIRWLCARHHSHVHGGILVLK